jgi:hypothetical protein
VKLLSDVRSAYQEGRQITTAQGVDVPPIVLPAEDDVTDFYEALGS